MSRKMTTPLVVIVLLGCILFWASPYLFVSSPQHPILIIYFDTKFDSAIYVLEDKSIEAIVGEVKWIESEDFDSPNIVRRATEDEGYWKKITNRKRKQLTDEQFQKLIELAEYLNSCDYRYPLISDLDEDVDIYYKGKEYFISYEHYDFSWLHDDYEQYSNTKYVRELADLFIEYSPIPISFK